MSAAVKRAPRKRGKASAGENVPAPPYKPTERETAAVDAYRERAHSLPPLPKIRYGKSGLTIEHADPETGAGMLLAACGFSSPAALDGALNHLVNMVGAEDADTVERVANGVLASVAGVRPQDDIEAMLAVHMAMTHELTMMMGRRLAKAANIPQRDSAERAFNKLARTFTTQMEALRRHRTGGQQKVVVEHVTVNEGGQAIVGNVETGGRVGKVDANPMCRANAAPRCHAHSKRTGLPCKAPAVRGWKVCRMHGAGGGAPRGEAHGHYRHGGRSTETAATCRLVNEMARLAREF